MVVEAQVQEAQEADQDCPLLPGLGQERGGLAVHDGAGLADPVLVGAMGLALSLGATPNRRTPVRSGYMEGQVGVIMDRCKRPQNCPKGRLSRRTKNVQPRACHAPNE